MWGRKNVSITTQARRHDGRQGWGMGFKSLVSPWWETRWHTTWKEPLRGYLEVNSKLGIWSHMHFAWFSRCYIRMISVSVLDRFIWGPSRLQLFSGQGKVSQWAAFQLRDHVHLWRLLLGQLEANRAKKLQIWEEKLVFPKDCRFWFHWIMLSGTEGMAEAPQTLQKEIWILFWEKVENWNLMAFT